MEAVTRKAKACIIWCQCSPAFSMSLPQSKRCMCDWHGSVFPGSLDVLSPETSGHLQYIQFCQGSKPCCVKPFSIPVANTSGESALKKKKKVSGFLRLTVWGRWVQCGLVGLSWVCVCLCILSSRGDCSPHGNPEVDRKEKTGVTAQITHLPPTS